MSMFLPVAKIDPTLSKRITTSVASANIQLPDFSSGKGAPNPWNTTANQPGGPRDLAARGLWMIVVAGSAANLTFGQTNAVTATAANPVFPVGVFPVPVAIPPGTWVAAIAGGAGTVDFIHVDAFRD